MNVSRCSTIHGAKFYLPPETRYVNNKIKNLEKLPLIFEPKMQVATIFLKKVFTADF